MSQKKNKAFLILAQLVATIILAGLIFGYFDFGAGLPTLTVRGSSMAPVLKPGDEIRWRPDFYNSNQIRRGDIVILKNPGGENKIIKRVYGLPGDPLKIETTSNSCRVLINLEPLKNTEGQTFQLSRRGCRLLKLYENDYKGTLPKESYLVLGENTSGTRDASKFGLISRESFLGKAEL